MCGIAAVVDFGSAFKYREGLLAELVGNIRHRGPDSQGVCNDAWAGLGMSRLAIVDVAGSDQPIFNEDRSLVLVCNGEIYNHVELSRDLKARGHVFSTHGDCETILHLYEEKGARCVDDLCGMFAFIILDRVKRRIFAARDMFGIKPLYYAEHNGGVAFCSEFSALARALSLSPDIDPAQAFEFLCYGYPVNAADTVDRRIKRLPPAHSVVVDASGIQVERSRRMAYESGQPSSGHFDMETFREIFFQALRQHLVSEVPSAIMLSGGLDSTGIATYARRLGFPMKVVTAGYEGVSDCDESLEAGKTAIRLGLELERIVLDPEEAVPAFHEMMVFCDEPVADIASVPQWLIYKRVGQSGIKVLHSGLGGDEIFYGYDFWNDLSVSIGTKGYEPRFASDDVSGFLTHPADAQARQMIEALGLRDGLASFQGADARLAGRFGLPGLAGVDRVYHLLLSTWLPFNCLHLADRLSMAHSIELRVPLLDNRLADYVHRLPMEERFAPGKTKPLFKRLLAEVLPAQFIDRPKRGFTPPAWLKQRLISSSGGLLESGWLAGNILQRDKLMQAWSSGHPDEFLFRAVVFESWLRNAYGRS